MSLRRLLSVLAVLAFVPALIAQAADGAKVVVYDLAASGDAPAALGAQMATQLADEIRSGGGVEVVRGAGSLTPSAYRDDARAKSADFYISGAIAPVGSNNSVLVQLVRTRTGLLAWSAGTQATTADDLRGQGAEARRVILAASRSAFPALANAPRDAPVATATPSPAPTYANRAQELVLAPAAPTKAPVMAFSVPVLGGSALAGDRAFAARMVADDIRRRGPTAAALAASDDALPAPDRACSDTGSASIVTGTLDTTRTASANAPTATTAAIRLAVYNCQTRSPGATSLTATVTAPIATDAIRGAIEIALAAYFGGTPPPPRF